MVHSHQVKTGPEKAASAFLRWAGSKRQLLPTITRHVPADAIRYIEPFAGSACLFFSLAPRRAILADINTELVATYRAVRRSPDEVSEQLKGLRRSKRTYLKMRSLRPNRLTPAERAARFIYLNRFCFNGLYRTNRKGEFNVPYGASGTGRLPDAETLRACSQALRRVTLLTGDFEAVLQRVEPGDFVYMDPPYAVNTRRVFNEYHRDSFSADDVIRVRRGMEQLTRKGVSFVVSYAESPEAEMLRQGFNFEIVSVRRNIAGFASERKYSREILIWSR
jgi:DNA adenine methylase